MPTEIQTGPRKIALVHDWLLTHRGGERVLEAIAEIYPQAEIVTLLYNPKKVAPAFRNRLVHPSWLNRLPQVHRYYRGLLPVLPSVVQTLDLSPFDLVLSTSHCVAKGVVVDKKALHICYSFTPMRYAWDRAEDYFKTPLTQKLAAPLLKYLRRWDKDSSGRVDHFITLSRYVQARIARYYDRVSEVVYPHVEFDEFQPSTKPLGDYYLVVSGFAPYKRIDLAIEACKKLKRKLVIVGEGPENSRLRRMADENIEFVGRAPFEKVKELMAGAQAFLFPGEEDFGIAPLESLASGRPVIALARGGALETLTQETAVFFDEPTVDALAEAIQIYESRRGDFDPKVCVEQAKKFSKLRFQNSYRELVENWWNAHRSALAH